MATTEETETFSIREFFEEREVGRERTKRALVAIKSMTREQARLAYPYRPYSKYSESRFGGDTLYDDVCLILNRLATRCKMCHAPTRNEYLLGDMCPDCDGRSAWNGTDPHKDKEV